jgi:hypothetical protein
LHITFGASWFVPLLLPIPLLLGTFGRPIPLLRGSMTFGLVEPETTRWSSLVSVQIVFRKILTITQTDSIPAFVIRTSLVRDLVTLEPSDAAV